jgi:hypothetical protein
MLEVHAFFNCKDKFGRNFIKKTCEKHILFKKYVLFTCKGTHDIFIKWVEGRSTCKGTHAIFIDWVGRTTQFGGKLCP